MRAKLEDKDKLRDLLRYYKTNQTEFAARLGFTQSTVAHWVSRNKIPYMAMMKITEEYKEISFSWLLTGLGPMLLKDGGKTEEELLNFDITSTENPTTIPGLSCDGIIQCMGMSFEPTIKQGDYIALKKVCEKDFLDPESIYLVITDGQQMLRHVTYIEDEDVYELTTDSSRRPLNLKRAQVQEIQKVVFVGRMLERTL